MSRQDYTAEHGPSWVDVRKCMDHIEGTFGGKITVTLELHRQKEKQPYIYVVSEFRTLEQYPHGRVRTASATKWLGNEFKTITALLYQQFLRMDHWLTSAEEDAARQAHF